MTSTTKTLRRLPCDAYTVGWLCALDNEIAVAKSLLDEKHAAPPIPYGDTNVYFTGRIGEHNVVIVNLVQTGTKASAFAVTHMLRTFQKIRFGLMVGIGGGAVDASGTHGTRKSTTATLLGDVVVSMPGQNHSGVLQYDKGTQRNGHFTTRSQMNSPGDTLVSAVAKLAQLHQHQRGNMARHMQEAQSKLQAQGLNHFRFPGRQYDLLFASKYAHPINAPRDCRACNRAALIHRNPITRQSPVVHHGLIASGNSVVRDPQLRDIMSRNQNVLCFEMEAAGLMNSLPCLVIKGISNYSDSHKSDIWQPYAALTAAAYAKDLLAMIQPQAARVARPAPKPTSSFRKFFG
ncbi:Pfs domain protein [Aspergillus crustosus]